MKNSPERCKEALLGNTALTVAENNNSVKK